jgi:hypothetical protein
MPRGSSFKSIVVLGVREGYIMCVTTIGTREIDEEEKVAPPVVRKVASLVVST